MVVAVVSAGDETFWRCSWYYHADVWDWRRGRHPLFPHRKLPMVCPAALQLLLLLMLLALPAHTWCTRAIAHAIAGLCACLHNFALIYELYLPSPHPAAHVPGPCGIGSMTRWPAQQGAGPRQVASTAPQ